MKELLFNNDTVDVILYSVYNNFEMKDKQK